MIKSSNSRRQFLGSLAILAAGTAFAGPHSQLLALGTPSDDLERMWRQYLKNTNAVRYSGNVNKDCYLNINANGQQVKAGGFVLFEKENLIAQPVWIYWLNKRSAPSDVVINVFENEYPYKKIRSLNRFELEALHKVSKKQAEELLLTAACAKNTFEKTVAHSMEIKTIFLIKSYSKQIRYYKNNQLILNDQQLYNI